MDKIVWAASKWKLFTQIERLLVYLSIHDSGKIDLNTLDFFIIVCAKAMIFH